MKFTDFTQIAGVLDRDEAHMIADSGVDYLGFTLRLAYHAEDTSEAEAARIISTLPSSIVPVLITYLDTAKEIKSLTEYLSTPVVQLHGDIADEELVLLRQRSPDLVIIKSLIVRADNMQALRTDIARFAPNVHMFITDTFDPGTGACGATGLTHDWSISRELAEQSPLPLILAGGLHPDNVAAGIDAVQPAGVDAHTGVEAPDGRKTEQLIRGFVEAAQAAFAESTTDTPTA